MAIKKRKGNIGNLFNWFSIIILVLFVIIAILAPLIAPYDPNAQNLLARLKPPIWAEGAESGYLLGTDNLGRDIFSRVIYGTRISILVGLLAVLISGTIGVIIGLLSGYYRFFDGIMMRIADIQLAFPTILLALAIVAVLGGGLWNLIIVLGVTGWVEYARVIRSEVLSMKTNDFVVAANTIGASDGRILFRHILPNILAPIITIGTFHVAATIIAESSLSFLGLGVPISIPSWGNMLSEGQLYVSSAWWMSLFPGLMIMFVVLAINILGDYIREGFSPNTK
ncbi:ABC transporter permease [Bacillus sp. REN16]|uniref:ABC transporter permease n=1 Tax=Bacillus sp. REN16 TaxID=2887296 RepID=UPI001E4A28E2|nr:ABC transporter permease [Bacillus sp. REN16]MCC3356778.1 ABC transporter permease [Bacillus sp. REN16]